MICCRWCRDSRSVGSAMKCQLSTHLIIFPHLLHGTLTGGRSVLDKEQLVTDSLEASDAFKDTLEGITIEGVEVDITDAVTGAESEVVVTTDHWTQERVVLQQQQLPGDGQHAGDH